MEKLRILHITPWFPNRQKNNEGIFIARHIYALQNFCANDVLHLNFGSSAFNYFETVNDVRINHHCLKPLIDKWRIKEYLATQFIRKYLRKQSSAYDVVNFYIAYPNAIKIGHLKKEFPKIKFCISEQWSAYHMSFGLKEESAGKRRIASIFRQNTPLFVVSSALGNDIRTFAKIPELTFQVIPNIVDTDRFKIAIKPDLSPFTFCSINNWSAMKNPFVLIEAFALLLKEYPEIKLKLGGNGSIIPEMTALVASKKLENNVAFLGNLSTEDVAETLQKSHVYCQSSNYETFSVICIEALASGTPVLATNIGGMKDFINENNGRLVGELAPEKWAKEMKWMMTNYSKFNSQTIGEEVAENYNAHKIGEEYYNLLVQI